MIAVQLIVLPISNAITIANRPELKLIYDVVIVGALSGAYALSRLLHLGAISFVTLLSAAVTAATIIYLGLIVRACYRPRALS